MKKLINGIFSSISEAELMTKISNDSSGMVNVTTDTSKKEPTTSNANNDDSLS